MKLSEAIRLGLKLRPQCRGSFFTYGKLEGSCVLGAAYEGYYGTRGTTMESVADSLSQRFPILRQLVDRALVPDCIKNENDRHLLNNVVTTLNDYKEWTREEIADWVEGIENGTQNVS